MKIIALGRFSVIANGGERVPSAPKQRQILALLFLRANRIVPVQNLLEELWDGRPPSSAVAAIHTYVMQLRRAMCDGHPLRSGRRQHRLVTHESGYEIQLGPDELDLGRFRATARHARMLTSRGHHRAGAARYRAALEIWRTPALVDVPAGPLLSAELATLDEERMAVLTERITADLRLGLHHDLVPELTALSRLAPTNEDLISLLMIALYRSGRQADALKAFHRIRRSLHDELGAHPSGMLTRLHSDMLVGRMGRAHVPAAVPMSLDLGAVPG